MIKTVAHTGGSLLLVGALAIAATTPAAAQVANNGADARCFAAMSMMQDKASKADKSSFEGGMMYYLGKMVGRAGVKSVGPSLEAAAASMNEKRAAQLTTTCADELSSVGDAM